MKKNREFMGLLKELSVLYVEDEDGVCKNIAEYLRRLVKNVYIATDGVEGWDLYSKFKPDIIILDINMPNLNGIELAKKIRSVDKKSRILVTTAYTDKEYMIDAVELMLSRYLIKPFDTANLLKALQKCVSELQEVKFKKKEFNLGGGIVYDYRAKILYMNKRDIPLTKHELALLDLFIEEEGDIMTYEFIEYRVWDKKPMTPEGLRSLIKILRKKTYPQLIENIHGIGYRLKIIN